jgi:hypothetical protein
MIYGICMGGGDKKMKKVLTQRLIWLLIFSLILGMSAGVTAVGETTNPKELNLLPDELIFIDTHERVEGVGDVGPEMNIDFPTYTFNPTNGILNSVVPLKNYGNNTKVIVGAGKSICGTAGGGVASGLTAYDTTSVENVFSIDQDGTVNYYYMGALRTVKPGEVWTETVEKEPYSGDGKLIVTYYVKNYGVLKKSKCTIPTPTPKSSPSVSPGQNIITGYVKPDLVSQYRYINECFLVEIVETGEHSFTDTNGFFKIYSTAMNGKYTLKISKENYLTRTVKELHISKAMDICGKDTPYDMWVGDLNQDGAINMSDVMMVAGLFNRAANDLDYNEASDLNRDGAINTQDIMIIGEHFNKSGSDYPASAVSKPTTAPKPEPPVVDSLNLEKTIVTADSGEKITDGKNIIFCPTFQMAWDGLKDIFGGDIELSSQPPLVDILNAGFEYRDSISEKNYLAMAGCGQETVENINSALKEKFKENAPELQLQLGPQDIISYAFLFKNLKFAKTFEILSDPVVFESDGQSYNLNAFGINRMSRKYDDLNNQVEIYDYRNNDDFIVKLLAENGQDEIILAKVAPGETLYDTYESVTGRMNSSTRSHFMSDDLLKIPVFDFNIGHDYRELEGKMIIGPERESVITKAYQGIRFRLDENGALLASEATIIASEAIPKPKDLVFDAPFLICLKQKDAVNPYLLIWVDNPELMANFNTAPVN